MKIYSLLFAAFFVATCSMAQSAAYDLHISQAESLYQKGSYAESATEYSAAFQSFGWRGYGPDRYNAARAWAMAGVPDSAFYELFKIAEKLKFDKLEELSTEKAFASLHALPRWPELCALVKSNQPTMPELARELAAIQVEDQKYRLMIDSIQEKFGAQSAEMNQLWDTMRHVDSINTARITEILDSKGWLGTKEVGQAGNSALFLVVQHAEIAVQEKYLPMMREAVKNGKAEGSSLALLEDRVLMRHGKKQIYGSQLRSDLKTGKYHFFPIEDVDHVDERRASVGLGPLVEYAQIFDVVWDAAAIEENRNMALDPADKN